MTVRRLRPVTMIRASTCLLALACALPGEDQSIVIEAPPGAEIVDGFIAVYPNGFVARQGELLLIGDALRHDLRKHQLYAEGEVVLVTPPVRIHAARLGLDLTTQTGDAWDVEAWIDAPSGRLPIAAEHLRFSRTELVFDGLRSRHHGAVLGVAASSLRVRLRDVPDLTRNLPGRWVTDLTLTHPRLTAFGVPILWLPALYRDFRVDYPWTSLEFGDSGRLGGWAVFQARADLPELLGWNYGIDGRVDRYTQAGNGYGAGAHWSNDRYGRGQAFWFGMDETVRALDDHDVVLDERHADAIDASHRVGIPHGAISARYVALPNPDPAQTDGTPTPGERFRHDFLRDDLNHQPLARQGVALAWSLPLGSLVLDSERRANDQFAGSDRLIGIEAVLPATHLIGPLHLSGTGWAERLELPEAGTSAWRFNGTSGIDALTWLGGLGIDAGAGIRSLIYDDSTIADVEQMNRDCSAAAVGTAGLRVRGEVNAGSWRQELIPRLGVEIVGHDWGHGTADYGFGDPRDHLETDKHWLLAGVDTAIWRQRELAHAAVVMRFALRDQDRTADDGSRSDSALALINGTLSSRPFARITCQADLEYDARTDAYNEFDAGVRWEAMHALTLGYDGAFNPLPNVSDPWEHRPNATVRGNRYEISGALSLRPGGVGLDGWSSELARRSSDGRLGITYALVRDSDGDISDQRIGVTISIP